jgi:aryl-alcohol dehydrogenase-like predicted oxidoreductase
MEMDRYNTLGRSGLRVSRLALGTMTFGTEWGWGSDKSAAKSIFDLYLDRGGNFIDTADGYTNGTSESYIGKFIADRKARDQVVLATKFTFNGGPPNPNAGGNSRKNMLRALEGSLKRLGTDYIDLYIMHVWDRLTQPEEVMRSFDDLVSAGKIRHVGLSNLPAWYASRAQTIAEFRGYEPVCSLQLEYSLIQREIENEFVDLATKYGMGITAWSPMAGGILSGKYKPSQGKPAGDGRMQKIADSKNPAFPKFNDRTWSIVGELEVVAKELAKSMAQVALNWAANRPGIASTIIGATKIPQLEDNMAALDFAIPQPLLDRLNRATRPEVRYPYVFLDSEIQGMVHGGKAIDAKHANYFPPTRIAPTASTGMS